MLEKSHENLRMIRFEGEVLPRWAQLLDLAARLCPVPEDTREWFSRLTNSSGVDDSRVVLTQCELLKKSIQERLNALTTELQRPPDDAQATQICAAWVYALDTMIQQASSKPTCSWTVEGMEKDGGGDFGSGGGSVGLRRV